MNSKKKTYLASRTTIAKEQKKKKTMERIRAVDAEKKYIIGKRDLAKGFQYF